MATVSDRDLHVISSLVTMGVMGLLIFLSVGIGPGLGVDSKKRSGLDNAVRIEAALAYKKKDAKTKQPQKRKKKKYKPSEEKFSRDENATPKEEPKDKPKAKPDEIDPMAILQKNRELMEDDTASDTGSEERLDEGSVFGSEWGSGDKNKGDPYIGGLLARMQRTFEAEAPGFIGAGKTVWGCVKLDKDGKVAESDIPDEGRSDVPALNSAMQQTLKKVPEMDQPVPAHLTKLLTEMGVCFRFKTK